MAELDKDAAVGVLNRILEAELAGVVRTMLQTGEEPAADVGDLDALIGVAKFPVRVKCALLSWNVLEQGLNELGPAA